MVLVEFGPQGWLRLVNCGHPPPLLVTPTGRRLLEPGQPAPPLGMYPTPVVEQLRLGSEDRLLLYTDGLVEARAADGRQFELDDRVEACLTAASLHDALDGLVELLLAHAGRGRAQRRPRPGACRPGRRSRQHSASSRGR